MKSSIAALSALAIAVQASPASYGAPAQTYSSSTPAETTGTQPGDKCNAGTSFCAGDSGVTNIILRCTDAGTLQPGNCNDNLNEPQFGAVCVDASASTGGGAAQCQANPAPSGAETGTEEAPASTAAGGSYGAPPAETSAAAETTAPAATYPVETAPAETEAAPAETSAPAYVAPATGGNATASGVPVPTADVGSSAPTRGVAISAILGAFAFAVFAA